jgi:endonuclease YncB( thermonuclease family)
MGAGRLAAVAAAVAALAAGCGTASSDPASPDTSKPSGETAVVAYVNDGDTLRTTTGQRVRLVQIDAPELHGDCYGKAALSALSALTPKGTRIRLVRDPALDSKDAYGRLLRYVFVNGTNANLALVREGAASPYFFHGDLGRYAKDMLTAVDEARYAKRGYWGACPRAKLNTRVGSITGPA